MGRPPAPDDGPGGEVPDDEWGSGQLDVDAYRERIGDRGVLTPTVATLRRLHVPTWAQIPFENVDVVLGRPIALGIEALQAKLVGQRRGGYCYEHNLLFAALLDRVGFTVTRLAARIRMGGHRILPKSHMCLAVDVDGERWLADAGFGGEGLLEPIRFDLDARIEQVWTYWLARDDREDGWRLRSRHADGWFDLYAFTDEPYHQVDFEVINYYTSTNPRSPFVARVIAQRTDAAAPHPLRGTELTTAGPAGPLDLAQLSTADVPEALRHTFGIAHCPRPTSPASSPARPPRRRSRHRRSRHEHVRLRPGPRHPGPTRTSRDQYLPDGGPRRQVLQRPVDLRQGTNGAHQALDGEPPRTPQAEEAGDVALGDRGAHVAAAQRPAGRDERHRRDPELLGRMR